MPLKFDAQGWLIPGSDPSIKVDKSVVTGKTYDTFSPLVGGKAAGIVWHWTGGSADFKDGSDPAKNRMGMAPWLKDYMLKEVVDPGRSASWNFFLDRHGTLFQHASIYKPTWTTCGNTLPVYKPVTENTGVMVPVHVNRALLGIEMENAGRLLKQGDNWYRWPYYKQANESCTGKSMCGEKEAEYNALSGKAKFEDAYRINPKRAITMPNGKTFDAYTQAQIKAATELARALKEALGWVSPKQIHYSHQQFVPKQKIDPGDLWMDGILPQMEVNVFGRRASGGTSIDPTAVVLGLAALGGTYWYWKRRQG
jgi:hypothetical protein